MVCITSASTIWRKANEKQKQKRINRIYKKAIAYAPEHGIDKIVIEDENESDGLYLSIVFYKNNFGEGEGFEQYRSSFYKLNNADLKGIKEETKVKKIRMKEKDEFGEWVRILEITL